MREIEEQWSVDDVWDANVVLDLYSEADRKATAEAETKSKR